MQSEQITQGPHPELIEASIADLREGLASGRYTARRLVEMYLERIAALDAAGPTLNSIIETNPDALAIADALDRERAAGHVRGPLHGIPIVLKDNIDTGDRMMTTAGSLALAGAPANQDATVVAQLRAAGAVVLGKANLSEWANFRSDRSSSGWCGRNGQSKNPYVLDRNPCGSSSGSGVAVSASLCAVALGTETNGSIVCPSNANGVVGIKPTVGLTSRAGVVPISHTQDTVGPFGRTVADAAAVLGALVGVDARDDATQASAGRFHTDYTQFLDAQGLRGARIGVARNVYTGYNSKTDAVFEKALAALRDAGAILIDPADIPTAEEIKSDNAQLTVLLYEFKHDLNAYLAMRTGVPIRTLADAIAFNEEHAAEEMPWFGQELFYQAEAKGPLTEPEYLAARETSRRLGGELGIDAVMEKHQLDAVVAPTGFPAWTTDLVDGDHSHTGSSGAAARAGYPLVSVPMGFVTNPAGADLGLPVNITFMGRAFSEPVLLRLAYAFEQATHARRAPHYLPHLG
jgi:amidase